MRGVDALSENLKFLLVDAQVLPDVFLKVVQAKMLLAQGKAKSSSQAAQMAGISRSAFYKYKDAIYLYDERMNENLVTFYLTLEDRPGVLSSLLSSFYKAAPPPPRPGRRAASSKAGSAQQNRPPRRAPHNRGYPPRHGICRPPARHRLPSTKWSL